MVSLSVLRFISKNSLMKKAKMFLLNLCLGNCYGMPGLLLLLNIDLQIRSKDTEYIIRNGVVDLMNG